MATAAAIVDRAIDAAGGLDRWRTAGYIEATFDAGGLLFKAKLRPAQRGVTLRVATSGQLVTMAPYPAPGKVGVLAGHDVSIRSEGKVIAERADARAAFAHSPRRWVRWDDLDFLYFAGAAMWTYLSAPFVFSVPEIEVAAGPPNVVDGETWDTIDVTFPRSIATHCEQQRFYVDAAGLIRRHDYTPEVMTRRAHGAHMSSGHRGFDGLTLPTRRRVYPRRSNRTMLGFPVLLAIDIHAAHLAAGPPLADVVDGG